MRIGIATDHGGFGLQEELLIHLRICMGGRTVGPAVAWDLVQTFLAAEYSQAERHLRRLGKVASLEAGSK
jgi:ribose 5-phosphate isomerase B